ncbi:hypothetical protein BV20DRAFT_1058266 [Pilatotrama ljubarskyi]|nr:hypothetical protein BV20DRAFT_1058266 [Pilatotrama ljubarskyi]
MSLSAPTVSSLAIAQASEAGPSSRPVRPLPPSRIPVRSKSLSAKPSATPPFNPGPSGTRTASHSSSSSSRPTGTRARMRRYVPNLHNHGLNAGADALSLIHAPAKRSLAAAGLSASPARTRPVPLPRAGGRAGSPRRVSVGASPSKNKFRIISAPPPRTIPTRPPTSQPDASSVAARIVSSPALGHSTPAGAVRSTPQTASRTRVLAHGSPIRVSTSARMLDGHPAAPPSSPTRAGKRGRDLHPDPRADSASASPSPSPTRARLRATSGGVPMRRT